MNYAEAEARRIASTIINTSSDIEILNKNSNELYNITKNNNNEIEVIDYNSYLVNKYLMTITNNIQEKLLDLENTEKVFVIPFGSLFGYPIFNNLGPKIPVRLELIGSVLTNINISIKEYGINNSIVEMTVLVEVKERVILPIITKDITITNEIPLSYKIINGKVPEYYSGSGINKSSSIYSIPLV